MKRFGMAVVSMLLAGLVMAGDRIVLKDGQVIEGELLEETGESLRVKSGDETIVVPAWAVAEVVRDAKTITVAEPAEPAARDAPRQSAPDNTEGAKSEVPPAATPRPGGVTRIRLPGPTAEDRTAAFDAWIELCVEHLGSDDANVRAGASQALRVAGDAAVPALEKAAASDEPMLAQTAGRLLAQAQRRADATRNRPNLQRRGDRGGGQDGASTDAGNLAHNLELSEEQAAEVAKILAAHDKAREEVMKLHHNRKADRGEVSSRLESLREERDANLTEVFTEEQRERYEELKKARTDR